MPCTATVCNQQTAIDIKKRSTDIIKFLHTSRWLLDSFVLDFFTENHWNRLPESWKQSLDQMSLPQLADFIDYHNQPIIQQFSVPLSLSLLCLRAVASSLDIPRQNASGPEDIINFLKNKQDITDSSREKSYKEKQKPLCNCSTVQESQVSRNIDKVAHRNEIQIANRNCEICGFGVPQLNEVLTCGSECNLQWETAAQELSTSAGQHKNLDHAYRKHVKPKKQHEIYRLAQIANLVSASYPAQVIVDIGAGQGHLSRLLSYNYRRTVITLEAEDCHVSGAVKLDKQAERGLLKSLTVSQDDNKFPAFNLRHVTYRLPTDTNGQDFLQIVQSALPEFSDDQTCCLLGLHTCGNLAPTMLRLFTTSKHVTTLVSVACCYMKLNCDSSPLGYPLSQHVSSVPGHKVSYEGLEVACHAIELYCRKLRSDNASSLKIHCCRATLEVLIQRSYPHLKHVGLRGVKGAEHMDFPSYVSKALSRRDLSIPEEDVISPFVQECLGQWKRVVAFYSLRVLLAPLVETLVLLDRMVYLYEHGVSSILVPVFDPGISPRNHVLVAVKPPYMLSGDNCL